MAGKKTANEIPTATNVYEGEELVELKLPLTKDERDDVFVRINRRTWQIKRGAYVKVPKCVADVLENAEAATEDSILFSQEHERILE